VLAHLICAPDIHVRPYQGVSQHPARALLLFALGASWHGRSFDDSGRFTDTRALLLSAGVGAFPLGLIFEQVTALKFTSSGADGGR
jgi:hypothetical protein